MLAGGNQNSVGEFSYSMGGDIWLSACDGLCYDTEYQ